MRVYVLDMHGLAVVSSSELLTWCIVTIDMPLGIESPCAERWFGVMY